jgi:hypothetical protein
MASGTQRQEAEQTRILLGLLESVERDGAQSQRHLAGELGIALGLVNAYLKRCVNKGLLKMKEAPTRRYAYYLTPRGFAEKSRLTVDYLSYSLSFFRQARADCADTLTLAYRRGWRRIALAGISDLAEISTICALESGIKIVAVVDPHSELTRWVNVPVMKSIDPVADEIDGVLVTDLGSAHEIYAELTTRFGEDRVLAPPLLGVRNAAAAEGESL